MKHSIWSDIDKCGNFKNNRCDDGVENIVDLGSGENSIKIIDVNDELNRNIRRPLGSKNKPKMIQRHSMTKKMHPTLIARENVLSLNSFNDMIGQDNLF